MDFESNAPVQQASNSNKPKDAEAFGNIRVKVKGSDPIAVRGQFPFRLISNSEVTRNLIKHAKANGGTVTVTCEMDIVINTPNTGENDRELTFI